MGRIRPDYSDGVARFFGDIPSYPNMAGADGIGHARANIVMESIIYISYLKNILIARGMIIKE